MSDCSSIGRPGNGMSIRLHNCRTVWHFSTVVVKRLSWSIQCVFALGILQNDKSSINFTFNNPIVQPSTSSKYLPVYITIDNQLSFKQHIILLENRVARSVAIIAKVSYYLPFNTLITIYHALVHSQLLYALPIWASTYKTYLSKLEKLQNKALRIIFKMPLCDPMTPLYRRSGILRLND